MKSLQEISDFIDSVDLGEPVYNITKSYNDINIQMDDWKFRSDLRNDKSHWLNYDIARSLQRNFSINENKMVLRNKDDVMSGIRSSIRSAITEAAMRCSPAEQPKRTKAYKGMIEVCRCEMDNDNFVNDIIPVLNYYYKSKTDSKNDSETMKVHSNNTFALLEILRKKYGSKSSS